MRRRLLFLLAVALSSWFGPTAGALTRTPTTPAPHYDEADAVLVVVLGDGITLDTFEGRQGDPQSLHKYLYCSDNPINRIDPSGNDDLLTTLWSASVRVGMWSMSASRSASIFRWSLVALNGIALAQDPGAFVSFGPAATADVIAADLSAIYNGTRGLFSASLAARNATSAFEKLAAFRVDIGVPPIRLDNGTKKTTTAMLEVGNDFWIGRRFLGRSPNRASLNPDLNPNNITRTHAEADSFNQAANAGVNVDRATLYVDRDLCGACGQRGGVKSMARSLGIKEITVVTPSGSSRIIIDPSIMPSTTPTVPVGLLYEILSDLDQ